MTSNLAFRFGRRPVHFRVPAAVVALETIPGFTPGIGQRDEGDGGVVERTRRLFMEQMDLSHHGNRGHIPGGLVFFFPSDRFHCVAAFTFGFVALYTAEVGGVVGDIHGSATVRFSACQMFMLKGLDKTAMAFPFLF